MREHLLTAEDNQAPKKSMGELGENAVGPAEIFLLQKQAWSAPNVFEHVNGDEYATWNDWARKVGANMVERLLHDRHECVVFDLKAADVSKLTGQGAIGL
jgi:hypothetical protein